MDELKLKIGSKFMKGAISGMVRKMIKKNFGYDVNVRIEGLNVTLTDGKAHVHLNADAEINNDDITKILTAIGMS